MIPAVVEAKAALVRAMLITFNVYVKTEISQWELFLKPLIAGVKHRQ